MTVYPNIPNVPGVPLIPRDPNNPIPLPSLLTGDTVSIPSPQSTPQWRLTLNGNDVVPYDNIVSFDYKQDWTIADYPIEQGGFESYDKVQLPFDARMQLSCGGSVTQRQAFLNAVANLAGDLNLYTIQTPEKNYTNCNLAHYDYRRTSVNGVGLLMINLYFNEIRNTASQQFTSTNKSPSSQTATKDPGAASQVNSGTVQPQAAPPTYTGAILPGATSMGGGQLPSNGNPTGPGGVLP